MSQPPNKSSGGGRLAWILLGVLTTLFSGVLLAERQDFKGDLVALSSKVDIHHNLPGHPATMESLRLMQEDIHEIRADVKLLLSQKVK